MRERGESSFLFKIDEGKPSGKFLTEANALVQERFRMGLSYGRESFVSRDP